LKTEEFIALFLFSLSLVLFIFAYREVDTAYNLKGTRLVDVSLTGRELTPDDLILYGWRSFFLAFFLNILSFVILGGVRIERVA